jgi:hypothetical protein
MDNPFGARTKADPGHLSEIKRWDSAAFRLGEDDSVMVTELRCTEPGCPPLETVIAVLGVPGPARQYKLHKAIAEVTEADVEALASGGAPACGTGRRPGGGREPS